MKTRKYLSVEEEKLVIEACRNNTNEAVAGQFGICRKVVQNILRENGVVKKAGPSRLLDRSREFEIVQMFNSGATERDIATKFGIGNTTVHRTLLRCGIEKPEDRTKPRISEEQKRLAVEACVDGATIEEAVAKFGMSKSTVDRFLRNQRISLILGCPATCEVDHTAFAIINRESAYWMGWMFTDGCISQDNYGAPTVGMNIKESDKSHVEKFRTFLKSTHAITHCAPKVSVLKNGQVINGGPSVTFRVRSEKLVADLKIYGMDWKKGERDYISPLLTSSADFWRGCVDGDGTLCLLKNRYAGFSLAGNYPLLTHFQKFLRNNNLVSLNIGPTDSGIFRIGTAGTTGYDVIETLYGHGGTALERKYNHAQELLKGRR